MKHLVAALIVILLAAPTAAQTTPPPGSPAANFRDDALLLRGTGEITQMFRHELDLLTDMLATCSVTGLAEGDAEKRLCEIASQRYSVAYDDGRAIDSILFALSLFEDKVRRLGLLLRNLSKDHPGRAENTRDIKRQVEIYGRLRAAISARNHELARQIGTR